MIKSKKILFYAYFIINLVLPAAFFLDAIYTAILQPTPVLVIPVAVWLVCCLGLALVYEAALFPNSVVRMVILCILPLLNFGIALTLGNFASWQQAYVAGSVSALLAATAAVFIAGVYFGHQKNTETVVLAMLLITALATILPLTICWYKLFVKGNFGLSVLMLGVSFTVASVQLMKKM